MDTVTLRADRPRAVLVLLLALLMALASGACATPPRSPEVPRVGVPHFSLATFNVLFEASGDAATLEAIAQADADVVCLQELNEPWVAALARRYARAYPYRWFHAAGGSRGLGVMSRFPLEQGALLPPAPRGFHRALIAYAHTPLGRVQLLVVHLRSYRAGRGGLLASVTSVAEDHELELQAFTSQLRPGPTLVAGDFNEGPDGRALRWLERRGFANALPAFHPGQPTWRGRSIAGQLDLGLDHILYDRSFEPLDARVVSAGHSDHLPVVAVLRSR